jgi:hypothetical protein
VLVTEQKPGLIAAECRFDAFASSGPGSTRSEVRLAFRALEGKAGSALAMFASAAEQD